MVPLDLGSFGDIFGNLRLVDGATEMLTRRMDAEMMLQEGVGNALPTKVEV